ncbi:MAG: hypothetical protein HY422_02040 [Candidatus Komeilibacteria bacterium]|nr:hypothetical protein [Candidatus Komeilibacteria bacterium]
MNQYLLGAIPTLLAVFFAVPVSMGATKPDLVMDGITVEPFQPVLGQDVKLTVRGHYEGESPRYNSEGFKNAKRQFTGFNFGAAPIEPVISQANPLQPGSSFMYVYTGSFIANGSLLLKFSIDDTNEMDEVNEANNTAMQTVDVFSAYDLPDLSWNPHTLEVQKVTVGENISITVSATYSGSFPLKSSQGIKTVATSLSGYSVAAPVEADVKPTENAPLASGGTFTYTFPGNFFMSGNKTLTFKLDPGSELSESDETNNQLTLQYEVSAAQTPQEPATPPQEPTPPAEPEQSSVSPSEWSLTEKSLVTTISPTLVSRLKGSILLQVQEHGEAWYVRPEDGMKYYMPDGASAYGMLRAFGLGITNADLAKIPVGLETRFADIDTDGDGLPDKLEEGLKTDPSVADTDGDSVNDATEVLVNNTNPLGAGGLRYSQRLIAQLKGRIVLQVESRGEAWYINPADGKRYYMKNGDAAYQIMRFLSVGITNADLRTIGVGELTQ